MNPLVLARALVAVARLVRDPKKLDEVFAMAGSVATPQLTAPLVASVKATPKGAEAIRERYRLGPISLPTLARMSEGTLGRAFADHMIANGLSPEDIPLLGDATDDLYVRAHLRETHDLWHVVAGFDVDVEGELGLQSFYLAQLPFRFAAAILAVGMLNQLLYDFGQREARMSEVARGWTLGRRARPMFGTRWSAMWSIPLIEVREGLGLPVKPTDHHAA